MSCGKASQKKTAHSDDSLEPRRSVGTPPRNLSFQSVQCTCTVPVLSRVTHCLTTVLVGSSRAENRARTRSPKPCQQNRAVETLEAEVHTTCLVFGVRRWMDVQLLIQTLWRNIFLWRGRTTTRRVRKSWRTADQSETVSIMVRVRQIRRHV